MVVGEDDMIRQAFDHYAAALFTVSGPDLRNVLTNPSLEYPQMSTLTTRQLREVAERAASNFAETTFPGTTLVERTNDRAKRESEIENERYRRDADVL